MEYPDSQNWSPFDFLYIFFEFKNENIEEDISNNRGDADGGD